MHPARPFARAVIQFAVIYGLLSVPWSGCQETYSRAFRWAGVATFHSFGPKGKVDFLPVEKANRGADTEIVTGVEGERRMGGSYVTPRLLGFLPTTEIIALILASSIAWRRRLIALVLGLCAVHLFIYLRVLLLIRIWYSNPTPWQQYQPGPTTLRILNLLNEVINISPTATFVVPVLIWIAVTFRYSDWERILRREPGSKESSRASNGQP